MTDPLGRPVPLQSLATEDAGQWKWNKPPQYADFKEFVEAFEERVEGDETIRDDMLDMLIVGATIEDIVNTVALAAFTEGKVTPDAAELAKPAIATFLIELAMDNEVPFKVFSSLPSDKDLDKTVDKITLMKQTNPEGFKAGMEDFNQQAMQEQETKNKNAFIDMES